VTEVQPSFDSSIIECQVTVTVDIQAWKGNGCNQPGTGICVGAGEPSFQANTKVQPSSSPDLMIYNRPRLRRLCTVWRNPGQLDRKG
jgi:hypothetical protein